MPNKVQKKTKPSHVRYANYLCNHKRQSIEITRFRDSAFLIYVVSDQGLIRLQSKMLQRNV